MPVPNTAATPRVLAAQVRGMTQKTDLPPLPPRPRVRLGAPKAITATAHKLARIVYQLMRYGEAYVKQTEAEYAERAREMGYELIKAKPHAETPAVG